MTPNRNNLAKRLQRIEHPAQKKNVPSIQTEPLRHRPIAASALV